MTFSNGAPGGTKSCVQAIAGTGVRQRAPQHARNSFGSFGFTPKRKLKHAVPGGNPPPMLVNDEPPLSDRAMLDAYWFMTYMTCAFDGSMATVAPSPPEIFPHSSVEPWKIGVPLSCVPPIASSGR